MKLKPKYIQLASEALIPLLGFFIWDWSLYFILLFYFIDMIANEIMMYVKSQKIVKSQSKPENIKTWSIFALTSFVTLTVALIIIHFSMSFIDVGIDFWQEAMSFWNYEEFGIKQGYLLVPLLLFVNFQQYKMEFLMPARYRNTQMNNLWKTHVKALIVVVAFAGICLGLSQFIVFDELVYVLGIVLFSILYNLRFSL
jgi:hypothetical protein